MRTILTALALPLVLAAAPALAATPKVSADLEPMSVPLGDRATLTITVTEGQAEPRLAGAADVDVRGVGRSQQVSIINGQTSRRTTYTYLVQPSRTGVVQVGPISVGGTTIAPIPLRVTTGAAPPADDEDGEDTADADDASVPAPQPGRPSVGPGAALASASGGRSGAKARRPIRAFLRIYGPKQPMAIGESVPVTVKAYFLDGTGVTVTGPPQLDVTGFTLSGLDTRPRQSEAMIRDRRYLVATWRGTLTAAKAGTFPLVATLPVDLVWREASPRRDTDRARPRARRADPFFGGADPFDDPFFRGMGRGSLLDDPMVKALLDRSGFGADPFGDDLFGDVFDPGVTRRRSRTLEARSSKAVEVAALPSAGKPGGFGGAVGDFTVSAEVSPATLHVGEPATVTVTVSGEGRFDAVDVAVPAGDGYKTYPTTSRFDGTRGSDRKGTKAFEQMVVPTGPGPLTLPPVALSYWDPDAKRYVTTASEPLSLSVSPAVATASSPDASPNAAAPDDAGVDEAGAVSVLDRALEHPWLPISLGAASLGLLVFFVWRRRRDGAAVGAGAVTRDTRRRLREAEAAGDAPAFFLAARQALREKLAGHWQLAPDRIDLGELDRRMAVVPTDVVQVFEAAERLRILPQTAPPGPLSAWRLRLDDALASV